MKNFENWLNSPYLLENEKNILQNLSQNDKEDSFYTDLQFGTAGIRGTLGLGPNRFNRFVVSRTTKALADVLNSNSAKNSVVIGYDCRNSSEYFAKLIAEILVTNGISVYLFKNLTPTPVISFAIRQISATAGINITASHNPKEYNGYKVYMQNGAQLDDLLAEKITNRMNELDYLENYNSIDFDLAVSQGKITLLHDETYNLFLENAQKMLTSETYDDFSVVFTPLFGTGYKLVPKLLQNIGIKNIYCVDKQMEINGNFPDLNTPNPEELDAYKEALIIAKEKKSDIIIATDPDADRVGVMLFDDNDYKHLSGNMVGCLLTEYMILRGNLPQNPYLVKSIVTSNLVEKISDYYNIPCYSTFTGFRFIAELIDSKTSENCLLALEESCGYLVGDFARDKDAITASALICQMTIFYKKQGFTLIQALENIYKKYGITLEKTISVMCQGSTGTEKIKKIMDELHTNPLKTLNNIDVLSIDFYRTGENFNFITYKPIDLKNSDVVGFNLKNGSQAIVRPSGTEPKVKIYILAQGETNAECLEIINSLTDFANQLFQ